MSQHVLPLEWPPDSGKLRLVDVEQATTGPTLPVGAAIRFRPTRTSTTRRLLDGTFRGFERDGSLAVAQTGGTAAFRSLPPEQVYVQVLGPRGGRSWQALRP